jgi:hypothetical protein
MALPICTELRRSRVFLFAEAKARLDAVAPVLLPAGQVARFLKSLCSCSRAYLLYRNRPAGYNVALVEEDGAVEVGTPMRLL